MAVLMHSLKGSELAQMCCFRFRQKELSVNRGEIIGADANDIVWVSLCFQKRF